MITRWSARWRRLRRFLSRAEWSARWLKLPRSEDLSEQHGLVMVQIDGLSRADLEAAVANGRMPFLQRLMDREHYRVHSVFSGLPSSTPSVQGELFYRQKCAVPAFGFRDHRSKQVVRMFIRDIAEDVQQRLATRHAGLLAGGSSYCNIYDGGAKEVHFCATSLGWDEIVHAARSWRLLLVTTFYAYSAVRITALLLIEFFLALVDFLRGVTFREFWQELMMIPARVVVVILMRELAINGAIMDTSRGLPVIHLNLLGYDEQAHRRRPDSRFAHWTLKGIDASIRRLWTAASHSKTRHYDLWVYSDHGQERCVPYTYVSGMTLQRAVERVTAEVLEHVTGPSHEVNDASGIYPNRASWLGAGWVAAKLFGEDLMRERQASTSPQVAALGPLGHVYLNREVSDQQRVEVARRLVQQYHVPLALVATCGIRWIAITSEQTLALTELASELLADHPFAGEVVDDLLRICRHADAGEIIVSGWDGKTEPLSFVVQHGAHAGFGFNETHAFALLPCDVPIHVRAGNYLRPEDMHDAAQQFLHQTTTIRSRSPGRVERSFRIMTYNVHACLGMDGKLSPRRIARVIAQSGADIVALQELDVRRMRTNHDDQAHEIARYLEMEFEFHPAWQLEEEKYGDAILSRFPMRLVKAGELPCAHQGRERRGALWVEVELPCGNTLQMLNTHLSLFPKEQQLQARALLTDGWLDQAWDCGPMVLAGDFNAPPPSASYQLLANRLDDVESVCPDLSRRRKSTWPSARPFVRIDHVFTGIGQFQVRAVGAIATAQANLASDHLPLIAELELA